MNEHLDSIVFEGATYRTGAMVILLDAWGHNPLLLKTAYLTPTPGIVCEDSRGGRHFSPLGSRVIIPDLFHPLMPWDFK